MIRPYSANRLDPERGKHSGKLQLERRNQTNDAQLRQHTDPRMLPSTLNMEAQVVGDDPDEQVADTIGLMSRYVREDAYSAEVLAAAEEAAPPGDDPLDGVFRYVKGLIRFQSDETTAKPLESRLVKMGLGEFPVVEVLIRPRDMLTWRRDTGHGQVGDCDDFVMLTAALLLAKGIDVSFVTVAADPRQPTQYSHVYVAAYPAGGGRVAMDTSHGDYAGWEVQDRVTRRTEWPIRAGYRGILLAGLVILALVANWTKIKRWNWRIA